jgi:asparagine synthase (glutamine-hydrolysing)
MCGISGILNAGAETPALAAIAQHMASAQAHRGPDDSGVWAEGPAALSHRRLSIIDLSEGGHQPMVSADGRYVMVFNGEIYNYRELRRQLGYPFRTQSDSEVLLAAYAQWGAACLHRLNGMFAFAVWDRQEQSLFLARDRMGIKPVYYAFENGAFCFASELRAVLASGIVQPDIGLEALTEYLRYQTVYAPRTLLKEVRMLEAGHFLRVEKLRSGEVEVIRWWGVEDYLRVEEVRRGEVEKRVRDTLRRAVERRLVADVPFGAFLSGGIDSSAVVGLMAEVSASPVHTFTVTFDESAYSEAVYAAEIAKRFRTEHTEIRLSPQHFLDLLPEALAAMDHPSGDGPNTYVVSKATKAAGITMALSGLGGDELFAGYDHFKRLYRLQKMGWLNAIPLPLRQAAGAALETIRPGIASQKISALLSAKKIDLQTAHALQRQVLLDKQIEQLTPHPSPLIPHPSPFTLHPSPLLSQISSLELATYLRHTLLRDTDQMSMAHALEVRVPFLDHELVELVLGIPDDLKYPHSTPKQLLVESLGDLLPPSIVHRPKMGFTLPFERWMKQELRAFCEERLGYLGGTGHFREEAVQQLWRDFLAGKPTVTWARAWVLVVLGDWMKRNISPLRRYERDV